jgi:hypothetical protein
MIKKQIEKQEAPRLAEAQSKRGGGWGWCGLLGVALFAVGVFVGHQILWGPQTTEHEMTKTIGMSEQDCSSISNSITNSAMGYGEHTDVAVKKLAELKEIYAQNCKGQKVKVAKPMKERDQQITREKLPTETCAAVERLLLQQISSDEFSTDLSTRLQNAEIYERLMDNGCLENREKYGQLADRERYIMQVLSVDNGSDGVREELLKRDTCAAVEKILLDRIISDDFNPGYDDRLRNAKMYAHLMDQGCLENKFVYKDLALRDLGIARAISNDKFYDDNHIVEIIELYQKLDRQDEARKYFEKVQRLTDPVIDLIPKIESVLSEEGR